MSPELYGLLITIVVVGIGVGLALRERALTAATQNTSPAASSDSTPFVTTSGSDLYLIDNPAVQRAAKQSLQRDPGAYNGRLLERDNQIYFDLSTMTNSDEREQVRATLNRLANDEDVSIADIMTMMKQLLK